MINRTETFEDFRADVFARCTALRQGVSSLLDDLSSKEGRRAAPLPILWQRLDELERFVQLLNDFTMLADWYIDALQAYSATVDEYGAPDENNLFLELDVLQEMLTALQLDIEDGDVIIERAVGAIRSVLENDQWRAETSLIVLRTTRFSVRRHFYSEGIRTLNLPADVARQPWSWSMLAHELGNLIVAPNPRLMRGALADAAALQRAQRIETLKEALRKNRNLFPLDFVAATLDEAGRVTRARVMLDAWIEELLEDAITVMVMGEAGLFSLQDMLTERYGSLMHGGARHPAPLLRLKSALRVLELTNSTPPKDLSAAHERLNARLNAAPPSERAFIPAADAIAEAFAAQLGSMLAEGVHLVKPDKLWSRRGGKAQHEVILDKLINVYSTFKKGKLTDPGVWLAQTAQETVAMLPKPSNASPLQRIGEIRALLDAALPHYADVPERFEAQICAVIKANYHDLMPEDTTLNDGAALVPNTLVQPGDDAIEKLLHRGDPSRLWGSLSQEQLYSLIFGEDDPGKCCPGCCSCCCRQTCSKCPGAVTNCPNKCRGNNC